MKILNQLLQHLKDNYRPLHSPFVFLVVVVSALLIIQSCQKNGMATTGSNDSEKIQELLKSQAYSRHISTLTIGKVATKNIVYMEGDFSGIKFDVFVIPLFNNENNQIAYIEAVKIDNANALPNGDEYALNLVDMVDYNTNNKEGVIKMYDLNYEKYNHSNFKVENGTMFKLKSERLPITLKQKYSYLARANSKNIANGATSPRAVAAAHPCDKIKNNNISFSECWYCIWDAIESSPTSTGICAAAHYFGPALSSCGVSVGAACVYISATM